MYYYLKNDDIAEGKSLLKNYMTIRQSQKKITGGFSGFLFFAKCRQIEFESK